MLTNLDWQARRVEVLEDLKRSQRSKHGTAEADAEALLKYLEWLKKMERLSSVMRLWRCKQSISKPITITYQTQPLQALVMA